MSARRKSAQPHPAQPTPAAPRGFARLDPAQRKLVASLGGLTTSARHDTRANTAAARAAFADSWMRKADPDGVLPEGERARRAEALRRAHFARIRRGQGEGERMSSQSSQRQPRRTRPHQRGDINDLIAQLAYAQVATPEREVRFAWSAMRRAWRFDLCWPDARLAVEVDGGIWTDGRHSRGSGYEPDCEKLNAAVLLSWRVLRFTYGHVESGYALATIEKALAQPTNGDGVSTPL